MRRVTIQNLKNPKLAKPCLLDELVDGDDGNFEIIMKTSGSEIVALTDIMEQIVSIDPLATRMIKIRGAPK